jgi:hypothetical protein
VISHLPLRALDIPGNISLQQWQLAFHLSHHNISSFIMSQLNTRAKQKAQVIQIRNHLKEMQQSH